VPRARLPAKSFATLRRSMIPGDLGHSIIPRLPASSPDRRQRETANRGCESCARDRIVAPCFLAAPLSAGDAFISQRDSTRSRRFEFTVPAFSGKEKERSSCNGKTKDTDDLVRETCAFRGEATKPL